MVTPSPLYRRGCGRGREQAARDGEPGGENGDCGTAECSHVSSSTDGDSPRVRARKATPAAGHPRTWWGAGKGVAGSAQFGGQGAAPRPPRPARGGSVDRHAVGVGGFACGLEERGAATRAVPAAARGEA